jgi:hypothetical protein
MYQSHSDMQAGTAPRSDTSTLASSIAQASSFVDAKERISTRAIVEAASRRLQRRVSPATARYYGTHSRAEEVIECAAAVPISAAIVTRNHYGCLVLNAHRTMFIDVDFAASNQPVNSEQIQSTGKQSELRDLLNDLRTVLLGERGIGFRIYRTAAGVRILATTNEYDPVALDSMRLMQAVGADSAFVKLCSVQRSFRARLTPKPWRCGARVPPHAFPRQTADQLRQFSAWLERYEQSCSGQATCRFLEHVGPRDTHPDIQPVVDFHDAETRAHQLLPLA